jgi:hypothetical protein
MDNDSKSKNFPNNNFNNCPAHSIHKRVQILHNSNIPSQQQMNIE